MADVQIRVGMPMDEFIREYEQEPFELVDGERIPLMPPVKAHGEVISFLSEVLILYKQLNSNFRIYVEIPFVLEDTTQWVKGSRVLDLMIYDKARIEEYEAQILDHADKPLVIVPDLCVEVISPTDKYSDVDAKVAGYLRDGVRLVWVFNPREKAVMAHTPRGSIRLTVTDTLDGGDVLPGFKLPLTDLFQP